MPSETSSHPCPIAIRIVAQAAEAMGSKMELNRNWRCGAELARKHGEGDHQAKRQRDDGQRGCHRVSQPGRTDGYCRAAKAGRAQRPGHGRTNPCSTGESLRAMRICDNFHRQDCGGGDRQNGKNTAAQVYARDSRNPSPLLWALTLPRPSDDPAPACHLSAANPSARIRAPAQPASASCEWPETSRDHSRTTRRHGCIRRARCRRS